MRRKRARGYLPLLYVAKEQTCTMGLGQTENRKTMYQVALLQSLTQGYFDGIVTVRALQRHGDTGIGTFDGVNGEMILLDGVMYQALGDGSVRKADARETVPFSVVTFFERDLSLPLAQTHDMQSFKDTLTKTVEENGRNLFYMVKVDGTFRQMLARSVLKQQKPYRQRRLESKP